ncbi:hypothetical protein [Neisseria shayeganii]|nr:hypothetical protein [Neisseria shayeganii]
MMPPLPVFAERYSKKGRLACRDAHMPGGRGAGGQDNAWIRSDDD